MFSLGFPLKLPRKRYRQIKTSHPFASLEDTQQEVTFHPSQTSVRHAPVHPSEVGCGNVALLQALAEAQEAYKKQLSAELRSPPRLLRAFRSATLWEKTTRGGYFGLFGRFYREPNSRTEATLGAPKRDTQKAPFPPQKACPKWARQLILNRSSVVDGCVALPAFICSIIHVLLICLFVCVCCMTGVDVAPTVLPWYSSS